MRKPSFCLCENKGAEISFAVSAKVTAKLISTFAFVTRIVQSFLNPKFQASSLLCLYRAQFVSDLVGNPMTVFLALRLK